MAKLIKFPLEMANGTKVRTLEDLKEHYDIASVIKYYKAGRLLRWLKANYEDEIAENLQELLKKVFSVLGLPEPSDEDLKNVDLRSFDGTTTEDENLKTEIKKHFKDTSQLDDWKIFQNESVTKDKCVVEFENEKLQTFTGKTFEKGENFANDVADFLTKLINFYTKLTALKSNENIKVGDIAYNDGSVSKEYDRTKIPVGIVIEVPQGRFTKIVSLDETCSDWEDVLKWCNNYADAVSRNWHLPTIEELYQLYEVKDAVNAAIDKITAGGGNATNIDCDKCYWSSAESLYRKVWCLKFYSGVQDTIYMGSDWPHARAVRYFTILTI